MIQKVTSYSLIAQVVITDVNLDKYQHIYQQISIYVTQNEIDVTLIKRPHLKLEDDCMNAAGFVRANI